MVRFVQGLVDPRMMESAVNPVDEEVGEKDEEGELKPVVERKWCFRGSVVQFGPPSNFGQHTGRGEDCHNRHGFVGLDDFEAHLILQVFWMIYGGFVKDKNVGESGANEIQQKSEYPACLVNGRPTK